MSKPQPLEYTEEQRRRGITPTAERFKIKVPTIPAQAPKFETQAKPEPLEYTEEQRRKGVLPPTEKMKIPEYPQKIRHIETRALKALEQQQAAIDQAKLQHRQLVAQRAGMTLTDESQREYAAYLERYKKWMLEAGANVKDIEAYMKKLKEEEKRREGEKGIERDVRGGMWTVTYYEDGKTKTKVFKTQAAASRFMLEIREREHKRREAAFTASMTKEEIKQRDALGKLTTAGLLSSKETDGTVTYTLTKPMDLLTDAQLKLAVQAGFDTSKYQARYDRQVKDTLDWVAAMIYADIGDRKEAERLIQQVAPLYLGSIKYGPNDLEKLDAKVLLKLRELEKAAEWQKGWLRPLPEAKPVDFDPINPLPPGEDVPLEVVGYRLGHVSLSATVTAAKALPLIVLGSAGGPLSVGLIVAGTVASLANPANRAELAKYVAEHPQEFFAGLAGAIAAGYSVAQAQKLVGQLKTHLAKQERLRLEKQWDQMIDDLAYREQQYGAVFPSKELPATEISWEQYVADKFYKGLKPEELAKLIEWQKHSIALLSRDGQVTGMSLPDLLDLHPELLEPTPVPFDPFRSKVDPYNALIAEMLRLHPNLVARVPGQNMAVTPLLIAALTIVARQGYITEEELKQLIKQNTKLGYAELTVTWTDATVKATPFPDLAEIVEVTGITTPVLVPLTTQITETVTITEPVVEEVPEPPPPEAKEEDRRYPPPKLEAALRGFRLRAGHNLPGQYRDTVRGPGYRYTVTVEARSYPDAIEKGLRARPRDKGQPYEVDVTYLGRG